MDKTNKFLKILNHFSETKDAFSLDYHATNLTFDVIGAVAMGEDMNAQAIEPKDQGELVRLFKELTNSMLIKRN